MTVIKEQMMRYLQRAKLVMDSLAKTRSPVNLAINRKAGTVKLKYTTGIAVLRMNSMLRSQARRRKTRII